MSQDLENMPHPGLMTNPALSCLWQSIKTTVVNVTNLEGKKQTYKDIWKEIIQNDVKAYMSLLILSGVHRSRMDSTSSLWDVEYGQTIFQATMSFKKFNMLLWVIRFDNHDTRPGRRQQDKWQWSEKSGRSVWSASHSYISKVETSQLMTISLFVGSTLLSNSICQATSLNMT